MLVILTLIGLTWLPSLKNVNNYLTSNNMDVNACDRLFTLHFDINSSTETAVGHFTVTVKVFNNEQNWYPKIHVKRTLVYIYATIAGESLLKMT